MLIGTVELRSKGPGRKGNPLIRERISSLINHFLIYFYIGYKEISVYRKNQTGPMKSLGAKFHCIVNVGLLNVGLLISRTEKRWSTGIHRVIVASSYSTI